MNKYVKILAGSSFFLILFFPFSGLAAIQGTLGATSQGSINISLAIAEQVQINNLSDVAFSIASAVSPADQDDTQDVCVYSNATNHDYDLTVTGDGPGFLIKKGTDTVPYTVTWYDANSGGGTAYLYTSGETKNNIPNGSTSLDCAVGGNNASLKIHIDGTAIEGAPNGTYLGDLTLLVAPGA